MFLGVKHITMVERFGIVCEGDERLNPAQQEMAKVTNREHMTGTLADAVKGADVFFGMSAPQVLTAEMVSTMAKDPMVFAMANPVPEICQRTQRRAALPLSAPAVRTTRTRSTTCLRSRAFSAAHSMFAQATSTRR